ncbi:hypothetical protein NliqN6_0496 [Naganishia liquefaciens]|uniref:Uncharacterized protein n=1 Tax=Naganishia liquefaciens TaxID=104408 RepID=A0A8H3TPS3_9TREE|nr:hypothetical protein NliqN6_0496 [Naganishia liquefaciens]
MAAVRPRIDSIKSTGSSQWGDPSRRPPSPTLSATTTGSRIDFSHPPHLLITRADLRCSIGALTELMAQAKHYRQCLLNLSKATSAFASALEACSRVKGCDTANAGILGASGLEHLIGNQDQLMADTFFREFEAPLLDLLDNYRASVTDRQAAYEKACQEKSHMIRRTEHDNMSHGRRRKRDLQAFRSALSTLQSLVDDLDRLKSSYHHEVMDAEDELWNSVLDRIALVEREKMNVHDKISAKSTDPSLRPLLDAKPDLVASDVGLEDGTIFSVLSPLNLMSTPKSPHPGLSRTPDRVVTPTPQEKHAGEAERSQAESGNTSNANNTKRRSFFGRLFQPSTENLVTAKRTAPRMPTRHARQMSQQSLASTADTYGEVLERQDLDAATTDSARRLREQQALMGREISKSPKRSNGSRRESANETRRSIHAPLPNPRRASSGNIKRASTTDQRELSVIEDEGSHDKQSGDEGDEAALLVSENETPMIFDTFDVAASKEDSNPQDLTLVTNASATLTEHPAPPGQGDGPESSLPPISEDPSRPSSTNIQPDSEEARKIPTAPPSPSLEHELEIMGGDKARKLDKSASIEI